MNTSPKEESSESPTTEFTQTTKVTNLEDTFTDSALSTKDGMSEDPNTVSTSTHKKRSPDDQNSEFFSPGDIEIWKSIPALSKEVTDKRATLILKPTLTLVAYLKENIAMFKKKTNAREYFVTTEIQVCAIMALG